MRACGRPRSKPSRFAGRRPGRRRDSPLTLVISLALLGVAGGSSAAATQSISLLPITDSACDVQTVVLPGMTSTSRTSVTAMSDSGLVVGTSSKEGMPSAAAVWTSPQHVIDTGVGGFVLDNGSSVVASAVDVNEAGLVAINRTKFLTRSASLSAWWAPTLDFT